MGRCRSGWRLLRCALPHDSRLTFKSALRSRLRIRSSKETAPLTELMQPTRVVDDIRTFFDTTQADPRAIRSVLPAAIRLLAEGRPVTTAEIADAANVPLARVETALRDLGDVEWTPDGRVEGMGLTPRETSHRIRIGETAMYA